MGPALAVGAFLLDSVALLCPAAASAVNSAKGDEDNRRLGGNKDASRPPGLNVSASKQADGGSATAQRQHGALSPAGPAAAGPAGPPARRAYATLLYSDFIEGTRALGQSLRESGTTADTVVLVTPDVREETRETLARDGWM